MNVILTDAKGRPLERPMRESFASDVDFVRAVHAHNDRVTRIAREAFDRALREAMRSASAA